MMAITTSNSTRVKPWRSRWPRVKVMGSTSSSKLANLGRTTLHSSSAGPPEPTEGRKTQLSLRIQRWRKT